MDTSVVYGMGLGRQGGDGAVQRLTVPIAPERQPAARAATPRDFTPRQLDVLRLLCEGLPNKLIGRRLDISPGTVKIHISHILRRLGVASRLQAVIAARRNGLAPD
jgi:DNA-binding NarL/FixJ family response regulator